MESTIIMLGAIGAVILVAALTSGLLERSRLPQVLLFLALGTAVGPLGFDLFDFGIETQTVRVVAVLGLVLVLFTDSVSISLAEVRRHLRLALLVLGPGTALTALVIAIAAWLLLDLGAAHSAILGAALASTDPVLLRGVLRNPATPASARLALRIESGMNDAVLLPVLVLATALLTDAAQISAAAVIARVLFIGGGTGIACGILAVRALDRVRRTIGIRRDYESLYVLAVPLTAFAIAETLGGSGFIAAFAAGVTVATLDVEMCECFYDYGEASAEMALLFTFVILGSSAIWSGFDVVSPTVLAFAFVALFSRAFIIAPALLPLRLDRASWWTTVWFGPRGLSSLLMVLLAVFAGVPDAERLFAITSLVVLCSIVIHGGSQVLLPVIAVGATAAQQTDAGDGGRTRRADGERIQLAEVERLKQRGEHVTIIDIRTEESFQRDPRVPAGVIRVPPDRTLEQIPLLGLPHDSWIVLYCM